MNEKIWRVFAQILCTREDLINIIKPFFENLKNDNINQEKYYPLLKRFSKDQLEVLYQNRIITEEKFDSLIPCSFKKQKENQSSLQSANIDYNNNENINIEEIISGDKVKELQQFIQEREINRINIIVKSFLEVEKMKIPLIQFCIMKKANKCFKYLLVNGYDDPKKVMEEKYTYPNYAWKYKDWGNNHRYEWDCMATAIYNENKEIIKILEEKGIEKGQNSSHLEAAILSYRNEIAKEIIEGKIEMTDKKEGMSNIFNLNFFLISSIKSNNIQGAELLIVKGADINEKDIIYPDRSILFENKRISNK